MKATYESVESLISSLAGFETIVDLVRPGTHLYCADELGLDNCLLVQAREDRWQVLPNKVWLRARGRVECRKCQAADSLRSCQ